MGNSYYQACLLLIMHRRIFNMPQPAMSREKNLVLVLLAILVTLILWNSFWLLWRLALFGVMAYIIYQLLRQYL
jgi:hypothetical protein